MEVSQYDDPIINRNGLVSALVSLKNKRKQRIHQRKTLSAQRIILFTVSGIFLGASGYIGAEMLMATSKYAEFVKLVNDARKRGEFDGPSGQRIAIAFHFGAFGSFIMGMPSRYTAAAMIIMTYEKRWRAVFDASGGVGRFYACIYRIGRLKKDSESALAILCEALSCGKGQAYGCPQDVICGSGDANVIDCLPMCDPTYLVQTGASKDLAIAGAQGAVSGALTGFMVGSSFGGIGGVIGGAIGLFAGGLLNTTAKAAQSHAKREACLAARQHCVMPPGGLECGGCKESSGSTIASIVTFGLAGGTHCG